MGTIKDIFDEFLAEQKARLKPRTYGGYEETIDLFEDCLNGYGPSSLSPEDSDLFDELYDEGKEFCEIFGPDMIAPFDISEFLDYFMVKKVVASNSLLKTVGTVMRKFVRWLGEKGYASKEDHERMADIVGELKSDMVAVAELSDLIYDYARGSPEVDFEETKDGYFKVADTKSGELWLEDYMGSGKVIGPVIVSEEISSKCKKGWEICLELGKTGNAWHMLGSGYVYQR